MLRRGTGRPTVSSCQGVVGRKRREQTAWTERNMRFVCWGSAMPHSLWAVSSPKGSRDRDGNSEPEARNYCLVRGAAPWARGNS